MRASSVTEKIRRQTHGAWTASLSADRYQEFGERYYDDPVGFARECVLWNKDEDEGLAHYQEEILRALVEHRRVCARGPHGLGKSTMAAISVWWYSLTRDAMMHDWKVVTTASAWRQLVKYLWPEIHKWGRRLNWQKIGRPEPKPKDELTTRAINLHYGQAFAVASNKSELIEGAHADQIFYLFDESKIIPDATWTSAEGAMVGDHSFWLAVSTPGTPEGRFYQIQARHEGYEDWWVRHVTLQEAVDAGRISPAWATDRLIQWGEKSTMYQNRVLGEFAQGEEDTLIPLHWVEAAIQRWRERERDGMVPEQVGVDVARMGGDKTVFAWRAGATILWLDKYGKLDTMEVTGLLMPHLSHNPEITALIDVVGVGAGVYDRLMEQLDRDNVLPFHPQEATDATDATELWGFYDAYSAAWWNVREWLDPSNPRKLPELLALPPDPDITAELTSPKWKPLSKGQIRVEPKETVKNRLHRSPDTADAIVIACWRLSGGGMDAA